MNSVQAIRHNLQLAPSGRPAKSTLSIVDKLNREKTRLAKMQDIAGCRIVVEDAAEQNRVVKALRLLYLESRLDDRRKTPKHGYRAVHVIVEVEGKPIEIQIRTRFQHLWAELSEKYADVWDPSIKYGGGNSELRLDLDVLSDVVRKYESVESRLRDVEEMLKEKGDTLTNEGRRVVNEVREEFPAMKHDILETMQRLSERATEAKRKRSGQ